MSKKAPKISLKELDSTIVGEDYYVFPDTTVTVCCLKLRNGFAVIGETACVSIENFDAELGRKRSRGNAREKIWDLEGYALKERIYNEKNN